MPASDPPPGHQARLDALVRHGLGSPAAAAVVRVARTVRRLTREHDVEVAAAVDADSGAEPAPIVRGTRRSVDVGSHLRVLATGREYVMLHSHPDSESFSSHDAAWLAARRVVRVLLVVGKNGFWYLLSRDPARRSATAREVTEAVQDEYDRLSPPGDLARTRGAAGRASRVREVSH